MQRSLCEPGSSHGQKVNLTPFLLVLYAASLLGFFGGFLVMAASGVIVLALLPFMIRETGKPLESVRN